MTMAPRGSWRGDAESDAVRDRRLVASMYWDELWRHWFLAAVGVLLAIYVFAEVL